MFDASFNLIKHMYDISVMQLNRGELVRRCRNLPNLTAITVSININITTKLIKYVQ